MRRFSVRLGIDTPEAQANTFFLSSPTRSRSHVICRACDLVRPDCRQQTVKRPLPIFWDLGIS